MEEFTDNLSSLREKVYQYLRKGLNDGRLRQGAFLNLNAISAELGMSRTPLRDALFQLEAEGYVTIFPRRGVMVNRLDLEKIRNIYEISGALESTVIAHSGRKLTDADIAGMEKLNDQMRVAVETQDIDGYYEKNTAFHNIYLNLSQNADLIRTLHTMRERLYDFPRSKAFIKDWELSAIGEHDELIRRLKARDFNGAAEQLRDVHWSFEVQERYARLYYFGQE
jgi:DNA-binding GntR family transcriptional regulator